MNIFQRAWAAYVAWANRLFPPRTVESDMEIELRRQTAQAEEAAAAIRKARFQRHMALANIEALEAWNHGSVRC